MFNLLVFRIPDLAESVSLKKYEKVMGSCKALVAIVLEHMRSPFRWCNTTCNSNAHERYNLMDCVNHATIKH
jgi:hypothetical protein